MKNASRGEGPQSLPHQVLRFFAQQIFPVALQALFYLAYRPIKHAANFLLLHLRSTVRFR